ncbi:sodium:solute symporter family transporter [Arthrobacter woluwensis]|uniref:sodium:solute symporter family transporter n=1 Tax=Arthrobacter woluwensis TaxID=156980 RepID=UPI001AAFFF07|nr:sodium:solute symporter family protein [Arthrobacter woluwensis]QTF70936.1 sodium:solute symporter family protein [Arthrobacter woluwensis]
MLTVLIVIGIVLIGAIGVWSRTRQTNLSGWSVGKRDLPRWTTWFLQAGESLTTFSFLGLAGLAYGGGMAALYAVGYLTISCTLQYFILPRQRQLGANRGYLTMADFFEDRFGSRALGKTVALCGAVFLLPYLQLQITGLGMIVQLATGSADASGFSMIVASVLVVVFVIWAGLRGIARVAIFKDFMMVAALVIVIAGVIASVGAIPDVVAKVNAISGNFFTISRPGFDAKFWVTSVAVTALGAGFNTFPHLWPPVLAAKSGKILRQNNSWIAIYQLSLFIPIMVGLAGILVLPAHTKGNTVLLSVAQHTLPDPLLAVIAIGGAAAAMVPAGAIAMGISMLVSNNLFSIRNPRLRFRVNHLVVAVAVALALVFGLAKSDIGALLLLTYGGLTQMVPAVAFGLARKVKVHGIPVTLGILAGTLSVGIITFADINTGGIDSGLLSLAPNLVVLALAEAIRRVAFKGQPAVPAHAEESADEQQLSAAQSRDTMVEGASA